MGRGRSEGEQETHLSPKLADLLAQRLARQASICASERLLDHLSGPLLPCCGELLLEFGDRELERLNLAIHPTAHQAAGLHESALVLLVAR